MTGLMGPYLTLGYPTGIVEGQYIGSFQPLLVSSSAALPVLHPKHPRTRTRGFLAKHATRVLTPSPAPESPELVADPK